MTAHRFRDCEIEHLAPFWVVSHGGIAVYWAKSELEAQVWIEKHQKRR